jgi:hypothetical protein
VNETNDGTPAHLRKAGVGPSFGGACHACAHFLYVLLEMMNLYKHAEKNIYGFRNFNSFNIFSYEVD